LDIQTNYDTYLTNFEDTILVDTWSYHLTNNFDIAVKSNFLDKDTLMMMIHNNQLILIQALNNNHPNFHVFQKKNIQEHGFVDIHYNYYIYLIMIVDTNLLDI